MSKRGENKHALSSLARSHNFEKPLLAWSCPPVLPSICPSAWNNLAPTGRILMKLDIGDFFFLSKIGRENSIFIKIRQE
jgi:hypothetical protein